jgi:C-terminal processing protease CtpA/Prc
MHHRGIPARLALLWLVCLAPIASAAPAPAPAPTSVERIAQVGRLWGAVRYLHPWLAYRDIDWDSALVAALPRIRQAKSREEYAAAVRGMLAALGDPATQLEDDPPAAPESPPAQPAGGGKPPALVHPVEEGIMLLDLPGALRASPFVRPTPADFDAIAGAKAVILDLRLDPNQEPDFASFALDQLIPALVSRPCRAPAQRYLLHSGYQPQLGTTSGGYFSGFLTPAADVFAPAPDAKPAPGRVVFLLDAKGRLGVPAATLALQGCGVGRIVSVGPVPGEPAVARRSVPVGEGLVARVRVSEIVPFPGWRGVRADAEVPERKPGQKGDPGLDAALREAKAPDSAPAAVPAPAPLPDAVFRPDPVYRTMLDPDLDHRQLAVIRAWNVIHYFYPYLELIGDWDAVLPEFLGRMEKASTGRDYALTIAEMMTHVPDGHTHVGGHPALEKLAGEAGVPLQLRWIENAAVVTAVGDEVKTLGIDLGDAIVAIDGESVPARLERLGRYSTGSTAEAKRQYLCRFELLAGDDGSAAVLSVQSPGGAVREVRMTRQKKDLYFRPQPAAEKFRILPGNLGYADLTRLTVAEVDGMFEKLKDTRGIVFDMRGYPRGTAWSIAPRLNTKGDAVVGARFRRRLVSAMSQEEEGSGYYFAQLLPPGDPDKPKYTGPTVMLIDDRAISQSEHSGLFYEAANGTKFVGTRSAGANGDVTSFFLPGGIQVYFTGHDVRHADGRQLQRVGLIPDLEVAPTRAGIHDGKDEVLESGMRYLEERVKTGEWPKGK